MIGGAPISWSSRNQSIVDLSSCEVKCVATLYATCQTMWIEMLLEEPKIMEPKNMKLFVDNKPVIDPANHLVCHDRSKHIERRYHFFNNQLNKGKIELVCRLQVNYQPDKSSCMSWSK